MRPWLLLLVLVAVAPVHGATVQTSPTITATGLAVAETDQGLVGTTARIEVVALHGEGSVYVDTRPLSQTDMQASARLAARVAADTLGLDFRDYDILLTFRSASPVVGGPSAGAVMAMAMAAAIWSLENPDQPWRVDAGVAATGTINLDGTIGPVGGVPAKAQGAARAGLHTVVYPSGQGRVALADGSTASMARFCDSLDIQCIPAASLTDLIRIAADRVLERPEPTVPGTADFPQLRDSVETQIEQLDERLAASVQRADETERPGETAQEIQASLENAQARLAESRQHVAAGEYYLGATLAFRGLIQQRYAEALMDLAQDPRQEVAAQHIDACADAVTALDVPDGADDWTAFFALAAAQVRVDLARGLLEQARQASLVGAWRSALLDASFCLERIDTVRWWQSLPELFLEGAAVTDAAQRSQEAIVRAADMVAYALSVQGTAGQAPDLLAQARSHHAAQRDPAAILYAVQAEAAASVSLQAPDGRVSPEVLDEALQGASRAVARARSEGSEPVLAVALIELAATQQPEDALLDLWTARGVALSATSATAPAPEVRALPAAPAFPPLPVALGLAVFVGVAVGAGGAAIVSLLTRR